MASADAESGPPAPSDALVFFGATGDLAFKKIFVRVPPAVVASEAHVGAFRDTGRDDLGAVSV